MLNLSRVPVELYLCEIQPANDDVRSYDISKRDSCNYYYGQRNLSEKDFGEIKIFIMYVSRTYLF